MTKEQFIEVLSGFVAERLVKALAEQAKNKGYFDEAKLSQKAAFDVGFPNDLDNELLIKTAQKKANLRHCFGLSWNEGHQEK